MDAYWVPGVNNLGTYGRWAFAEFTEVYQIESDFKAKIEKRFDDMIGSVRSTNGSKGDVEDLLSRTFGDAGAIRSIAEVLLKTARADAHRGVVPSDIDRLSEVAGCSADDALGVLAILARPSIGILRMEVFDPANPNAYHDTEAFVRHLRERRKRAQADQGKSDEWASSVRVRWVVSGNGGHGE